MSLAELETELDALKPEIILRSGQHVWTLSGDNVKNETISDFAEVNRNAFDNALQLIRQFMLRIVAKETGEMRKSFLAAFELIDLTTAFEFSFNHDQFEIYPIYAMFHSLRAWFAEHGRNFYKAPTTQGTAPIPFEAWFQELSEFIANLVDRRMLAKGYEVKV